VNDLEKKIAAIWKEVLNVESVGRAESFFDLGGHSLLMVQVQSRLKEDLDREVPMIRLFEHPTVASQAAMLEGSAEDEARPLVGQESEQKVLRGRDRLRARSARRQRLRAV
jgi:acyl carrier protein